jgi:hypothetical protein
MCIGDGEEGVTGRKLLREILVDKDLAAGGELEGVHSAVLRFYCTKCRPESPVYKVNGGNK